MNTHETLGQNSGEFSPSSETFFIPSEFQQNLGHVATALVQEAAELEAEKTPEQIAESFQVNEKDYPIFSKQQARGFDCAKASDKSAKPDEMYDQNINETLGRYVRDTADLIAKITGSGEDKESKEPYDHVVYLDKSGRPVAWLVGAFWDEFAPENPETKEPVKQPGQSFIAIDRQRWFNLSNTDILPGEHIRRPDDSVVLATFDDFNADGVDPEYFAKLRSLYLKDGITGNETPEEIMHTPSTLDGKRVLIVDEVKRSGATLDIAEWLFKNAFPDTKFDQAYFWNRSEKDVKDSKGNVTDVIVGSIPIWYNHTNEGRGVGDINPPFYDERAEQFIEQHPDKDPGRVKAQAYGSEFLGAIADLDKETKHSSRALAQEIVKMADDYHAGKILMSTPVNYNIDKFIDHYENLGVIFAREGNNAKNTYVNIKKSYQK